MLEKVFRFSLVRIVLGFLIIMLATSATQDAVEFLPGRQTTVGSLGAALIVALIGLLTYVIYVRMIERRAVTELSPSGAIGELLSGSLVGAFLFTTTIAILWAAGYYQVTGSNDWSAIALGLEIAIVAGVVEELLFRGILFRLLEQSLGSWLALSISALFFGLVHMANPDATLASALAIALEAGILLAAAYMFTRHLWLAIGLHFAWNFTQGSIFGVAISGNKVPGLLQGTLSGPPLLAGGEFGAEASLFAVIVCLAAGLFFLWRAYQKGNFVKPFWQRSEQSVSHRASG